MITWVLLCFSGGTKPGLHAEDQIKPKAISLPSVPNFKNVVFYSENEIFSAIFDNST